MSLLVLTTWISNEYQAKYRLINHNYLHSEVCHHNTMVFSFNT